MYRLKALNRQSTSEVPNILPFTAIHNGHRYQIVCDNSAELNTIHGVIGGYRINAQGTEILPISVGADQEGTCYFWDSSCDVSQFNAYIINDFNKLHLPMLECNLQANRLILNQALLNGPELRATDNVTSLNLSPYFEFTFNTDDFAAQLGAINLVQSTRIIRFENNNELVLLDTGIEGPPVLHLEDLDDDQAVKYVSLPQQHGTSLSHVFEFTISQHIPDQIRNENVTSVTVLERYCTYIMQRAVSSEVGKFIWTPTYAPIVWGWSIRVGRRTDGEWCILRRKLILPTIGNEGLQLPEWSSNTLKCSTLLG